jgi:hypothetical protein
MKFSSQAAKNLRTKNVCLAVICNHMYRSQWLVVILFAMAGSLACVLIMLYNMYYISLCCTVFFICIQISAVPEYITATLFSAYINIKS